MFWFNIEQHGTIFFGCLHFHTILHFNMTYKEAYTQLIRPDKLEALRAFFLEEELYEPTAIRDMQMAQYEDFYYLWSPVEKNTFNSFVAMNDMTYVQVSSLLPSRTLYLKHNMGNYLGILFEKLTDKFPGKKKAVEAAYRLECERLGKDFFWGGCRRSGCHVRHASHENPD